MTEREGQGAPIESAIHRRFVDAVIDNLSADNRFTGLLAGGSLLHGGFDAFSDLDLILVVTDHAYDAVMADRQALAAQFGDLHAAFTGEHVGEPRLLICLYGDLPLHVDLKFVVIDAMDNLVERPVILWRRSPDLDRKVAAATVDWPNRPAAWFEDRFWIWIHYGATKIGRGEVFEAIALLAFIREQVLGPLIHQREGRPQRGVRRLEHQSPDWSVRLKETVASPDRDAVLNALRASVAIYRELREPTAPSAAETTVMDYVDRIVPGP